MFLLGGVSCAGWTVVDGTSSESGATMMFGIDFADCALSGLCRSSGCSMASDAVASDRRDSLLLLYPNFLSCVETAVEADKCRSELGFAIERRLIERFVRLFRAGSIRTAFSIHISCVYELNLAHY